METNTLEKPEHIEDQLIKDETTLKTVAGVILMVGVMAAMIVFFTTALIEVSGEYLINWNGFISTVVLLMFSVGAWSFLKVVSNISISLKENNKN